MTAPPLPDTPTVRVRTIWNEGAVGEGGNRWYLSFAGGAPSGANCIALATAIAGAWATHLAPLTSTGYVLNEVDVLDISTLTGLSGQWTGENAGTGSGADSPDNTALNVEFGIARRYRGGKPRFFLSPPGEGNMADRSHWSADVITEANTNVAAYFSAIEALDIGSMGALRHVNLSYYSGFTNHSNTSGRERAVPTYRASALSDPITGYFAKAVIGSQRRRRTSTTP